MSSGPFSRFEPPRGVHAYVLPDGAGARQSNRFTTKEKMNTLERPQPRK